MTAFRPLWADIDLDALRHNYRLALSAVGQGQCVAVLKANAYGHGAVACAKALADLAPAFAVAAIEEAEQLREAGITQPIVLLEGFFSVAELPLISERGYWVAVHQQWQVDALLAVPFQAPIPIWLKLDSGMHRLGFDKKELVACWQQLTACPQVADLHLMTHFATADEDSAAAQQQYDRQRANIDEVIDVLQTHGFSVPCCLANSAATLRGDAEGVWHRPGIMLYGVAPCQPTLVPPLLRSVMTLRSRLIAIRTLSAGESLGYGRGFVAEETLRIGIVACGYGDGYDRHARTGTPVLVDGQRTRLLGRVSMDMLAIDLTDLAHPSLQSDVVLWGQALSGETLPIEEVAHHCDTIAYTLMTGVTARVPRRYHATI